MLRGPQIGVRRQLPQSAARLDPGLRGGQVKAQPGEPLVIGQPVGGQIAAAHLPLPPLDQGGDLRVALPGPIKGDQTVIRQGLFPRLIPGQSDRPQIFSILPGGDDIGLTGQDGLLQRSVGVSGDDQVDPLHRPGQFLILRGTIRAGPAVGQADDHFSSLLFQPLHTPAGGPDRVLQHKTGCGGAGVGVPAHQAKNSIGHAAALQKQGLLHPVRGHGPLEVQAVLLRPVVGQKQGRGHIPAPAGGGEHLAKPRASTVKFVVSHRHSVIAHGAHGAKLRRLGGIQGLDQGAHREIPAVHSQRPRMGGPLLLQCGGQPGIAARGPSAPVLPGQEAGVEVVGK